MICNPYIQLYTLSRRKQIIFSRISDPCSTCLNKGCKESGQYKVPINIRNQWTSKRMNNWKGEFIQYKHSVHFKKKWRYSLLCLPCTLWAIVFKASPRRCQGIRAVFESRCHARCSLLTYGAALGQKASPRRQIRWGGRCARGKCVRAGERAAHCARMGKGGAARGGKRRSCARISAAKTPHPRQGGKGRCEGGKGRRDGERRARWRTWNQAAPTTTSCDSRPINVRDFRLIHDRDSHPIRDCGYVLPSRRLLPLVSAMGA
jgi:hypothetical protein